MTFDELLAQVIDLLQRQGRVSYGALKRRFALDDDYLQDLKDELIDAQRVAVDEEGKVLVWLGEGAKEETENRRIRESGKEKTRDSELRTPNSELISGERRQLTRSCSVTWWARPRSPNNLTLKSCARWCAPIKKPVRR